MPVFSESTHKDNMELVQQAMTMNPNASLRKIEEMVRKMGRPMDKNYIAKLKRKIIGERRTRLDYVKVNERLSILQDKAEMAQAKLWEILSGPRSNDQNRINAAKAIIKIETELINAQMDAGVFERKLGTIDIEHTLDKDDPAMDLIINAFRNYGIIREAVPVEAKQIDGPTNGNNS